MNKNRAAWFMIILGLIFVVIPGGQAHSLPSPVDSFRIITLAAHGRDRGNSLAFFDHGKQLAVAATGGIYIFDAQSLSKTSFLSTPSWARGLSISQDGKMLAAGLFDGTARLWSLSGLQPLHTLEGHVGWVRAALFTPDGSTLVTLADDDTLRLWDITSGLLRLEVPGLTGARTIALSPLGEIGAIGLQDGSIQLRNLEDGELINSLLGHTDWVRCLAFSPDGLRLASGAFDATVRLWDVASGQLLNTLSDHESSVLGVTFSPDGHYLASGSADTTVRLWDAAAGVLLKTMLGHTDFVYSVAFSPDGRTLASGSGDNTVRLWDLESVPQNTSVSLNTPKDCRACHHPRGTNAPARIPDLSCKACHAAGISMNWCAFFPRAAGVVTKTTAYVPYDEPPGIPIGTDRLVVNLNFPSNGETLYSSSKNVSPVFISGRVYFAGDISEVRLFVEVWAGDRLLESIDTAPDQVGAFRIHASINPDGDTIQAGAKAGDPDCAACHEDFKSQLTLPEGRVRLVVRAETAQGEEAVDSRWFVVDTSSTAVLPIEVLDQATQERIPNLPVEATAILYEWRQRTATDILDNDDRFDYLQVESLSGAPTLYHVSIRNTIVNGRRYDTPSPVEVVVQPGETKTQPITLWVRSESGQLQGRVIGEIPSAAQIRAIDLSSGAVHLTRISPEGQFTFENLPVADYLLVVDPVALAQAGIAIPPRNISLTDQTRLNVILKPVSIGRNMFGGRILDNSGNEIPFSWMTTEDGGLASADPFTGSYQILGIESNKAIVIANAPGFYSQAGVVNMKKGEFASLDFNLKLRPDTRVLPWGSGTLLIPSDSSYVLAEDGVKLTRGWLWGTGAGEAPLEIEVSGLQVSIRGGSFALEYQPPAQGWFYLQKGEALIEAQDGSRVHMASEEVLPLSAQPLLDPVLYQPGVRAALNAAPGAPVPTVWEPTLAAQVRDRLARLGINFVQILSFAIYMLGPVVLVSLGFWGLNRLWKRSKG